MSYKIECSEKDAPKFLGWIQKRGGVAKWASANLSNPGASWSTPATIRRSDCDGPGAANADDIIPYPKPTWEAGNSPEYVVTDPEDIEVYTSKEFKRFSVSVRRGDGLMLKCSDAASRRIHREIENAGKGSFYRFDYDVGDCVIFKSESLGSLKDWERRKNE